MLCNINNEFKLNYFFMCYYNYLLNLLYKVCKFIYGF